jgi:hypothetical protein
MKTIDLRLPASFEQGEEITEHLLHRQPLVILPSERAMLMKQARQKHPGCRIVAANLDIENADWTLTLEVYI